MAIPTLSTGSFCCHALRARVGPDLDSQPFEFGHQLYASTAPPFYIDDWWEEQLGKIEIRSINECTLFLLMVSSNPAVSVPELNSYLHSYYYSLILQNTGYSHTGILLGGENTSDGLRVNTIGRLIGHHEPYKVISANVTQANLLETAKLVGGIGGIFAEGNGNNYLRLRKGFNALLDAVKHDQLHNRLHQCVRAIEAIIKPKQGDGLKKFQYRCQLFAGRSFDDATLLGELYELRSAAEHLNPMDDKLTAYPEHERDKVKALRTFQAELLASFIYRKIFSTPELLKDFVNDYAVKCVWDKRTKELIQYWGNTIDLRTAPEGLFFDYL